MKSCREWFDSQMPQKHNAMAKFFTKMEQFWSKLSRKSRYSLNHSSSLRLLSNLFFYLNESFLNFNRRTDAYRSPSKLRVELQNWGSNEDNWVNGLKIGLNWFIWSVLLSLTQNYTYLLNNMTLKSFKVSFHSSNWAPVTEAPQIQNFFKTLENAQIQLWKIGLRSWRS